MAVRYSSLLLLLFALLPGVYVFNYFCGCLHQDPIDVAVDTQDRLNVPPEILYANTDPPWNVTFILTTGTLPDGEPLSVYQYWYFWPGCTLAPQGALCLSGHAQNDWEPAYVYWKTTNPTAPTLLSVYTRVHFGWKQTQGSLVTLNATAPIITFSAGFHVPTVDTGLLNSFLKPTNATLSIPYNTNGSPPFSSGTWYYPLLTGNRYIGAGTQEQVWNDPNSPPSTGPTAYENDAAGNAGPTDPLALYGTSQNIQNGILGGLTTTFLAFLGFVGLENGFKFGRQKIRLGQALGYKPRSSATVYGQFLGFNILLSVAGWAISLFLGQFFFNNAGAIFQYIANLVPIPPPYYGSASLWAFFVAGAVWFAIASGITVLFFARRTRAARRR